MDNDLKKLIHDGNGEHELEKYVRQNSPSIRADGVRRILAGQTSLEEVLRLLRMTSPIDYRIENRVKLPDGSFSKKKVILFKK